MRNAVPVHFYNNNATVSQLKLSLQYRQEVLTVMVSIIDIYLYI